jgi:hypothetical protein
VPALREAFDGEPPGITVVFSLVWPYDLTDLSQWMNPPRFLDVRCRLVEPDGYVDVTVGDEDEFAVSPGTEDLWTEVAKRLHPGWEEFRQALQTMGEAPAGAPLQGVSPIAWAASRGRLRRGLDRLRIMAAFRRWS